MTEKLDDLGQILKRLKSKAIKDTCDMFIETEASHYNFNDDSYVGIVYDIKYVYKLGIIDKIKQAFSWLKSKVIVTENSNVFPDVLNAAYIVLCKGIKAKLSDTGYFFTYYILDINEFLKSERIGENLWEYKKPVDWIEVYADYNETYPRVSITQMYLSEKIPDDSDSRDATLTFVKYLKTNIWTIL